MSSVQHPEDQGSSVIPTVEITDYSTESTKVAQDSPSPPYHAHSSLSPPSRRSSIGKRRSSKAAQVQSVSDQEQQDSATMSLRVNKRHSKSGKSKHKTDDWNEVTEPEERRRIQNRIAQRKFREKAREQKERAQRDAQNQEYAASSYRVPEPEELGPEDDLSGLPWGSLNMRFVVAKGHESASQLGSRQTSDHRIEENQHFFSPNTSTFPAPITSPQLGGYDSRDSIGDDSRYYDETPYYYDYDMVAADPTQHL